MYNTYKNKVMVMMIVMAILVYLAVVEVDASGLIILI